MPSVWPFTLLEIILVKGLDINAMASHYTYKHRVKLYVQSNMGKMVAIEINNKKKIRKEKRETLELVRYWEGKGRICRRAIGFNMLFIKAVLFYDLVNMLPST